MYPLTCHAGFNVPLGAGKYEIVGFSVQVDVEAQDTEIAIVDDMDITKNRAETGYVLNTLSEKKGVLVYKKLYDAETGQIDWFPPDTIKTRHGISIFHDNIKQGSLCLYVR